MKLQHSMLSKMVFTAIMLIFVALTPRVLANSIDELINNNKLTINLKVKDNSHIIAKQPVVIELEVATERWFNEGTKIGPFSVANTVILPNNNFTSNSTKSVNGETWSTQNIEFTLYPIEAGSYTLPPLNLSLNINTDNGAIQGAYETDSVGFNVTLPTELTGVNDFVVTPNFNFSLNDNSLNFTPENEKNNDNEALPKRALGEAFVQKVTFKADNVPSMMLPQLNIQEIDGLSIYKKPPELHDSNVRGTLVGTRTETVTYIFEKPGIYEIPAQTFTWWDNEEKTVKTTTMSQKKWRVEGALPSKNSTDVKASSLWLGLITSTHLYWLTGILFFLIMVFVGIKNKQTIINVYAQITHLAFRQVKQKFIQAINDKDYVQAADLLYHLVLVDKQEISLIHYFNNDESLSLLINKLLTLAYYHDDNAQLSAQEATLLINTLNKNAKPKQSMQTDLTQLNPK